MNPTSLFRTAALFAGLTAASFAQESADRFYQAIRTNDASALQALLKSGNLNEKDKHGTTPLHYAAAYGSVESVRSLLAAGADVNARNDFEATPLMWAVGEPEKVRLLVEKGADVNVKSKMGRTAVWLAAANDGSSGTVKYLLEHGAKLDGSELLAATAANDPMTVRLLLDKGADVKVKDPHAVTPLFNAAMNGNLKLAEMLLARGADVNAACSPDFGGTVKNGSIALGSLTPLMMASVYGPVDLVKLLLDAGAKIDAEDIRQMTALTFAATPDHGDPRIVRLLLARGADAKHKDREGMTAADWAKKQNNPAMLRELGVSRQTAAARPTVVIPVSLLGARDPRPAAAKSIELLQRASGNFFKEGGCGACHAQNLTSIAVNAAYANRIPLNEQAKAAELKGAQLGFAAFEQPLLQRGDPPVPEILSYFILQLGSEGAAQDRTTDAIAHNLMAEQRQAGNWHMGGIARPPSGDGDFTRTAIGLRALALCAPAGLKAEAQRHIERAANWLASTPTKTTEDLTMQLLGLKWAGTPRHNWQTNLHKLAALQREDGGWGQTPDLPTDAYATGQTLYAMHELGVPASDPAYRRGVQYLLQTQADDGSWHVKSRTPKIQPYFETIFPYGHDQWISNAATSWAAAALSYASAPHQVAKR